MKNPRPFIIFALPRSGSTWLSAFLSHDGWICVHDPSIALQDVRHLESVLAQPNFGICDTQLVLLWTEIVARWPHARFVTLRRPMEQILRSAAKLGFAGPKVERNLLRLDCAMKDVEKLRGVLCTSYGELGSAEGARKVFEFCLPVPWDPAWYNYLSTINIQVDARAQLQLAKQNEVAIRRVFGPAVNYYDSKVLQ